MDLFRRTKASGLYRDGVDISLIAKVLSHSSIETTKDHYAVPSLEQKKAAVEKGSVYEPDAWQEQIWPDVAAYFTYYMSLDRGYLGGEYLYRSQVNANANPGDCIAYKMKDTLDIYHVAFV